MGDMADYLSEQSMIYEYLLNEEDYQEKIDLIEKEYKQGILLWEMKDGQDILVTKMKDTHVLNCYMFLNKKENKNILTKVWIYIFKQEIVKRKIK